MRATARSLTLKIVLVCCICTAGEAFAIFDLIPFMRWKKEITARLDETFENLVPAGERGEWKKVDDESFLGDIGEEAWTVWIPKDEFAGGWSNLLSSQQTSQIKISYICKPFEEANGKKRQYAAVSECFETIKNNISKGAGGSSTDWLFSPIHEGDAIVVKQVGDVKEHWIYRLILLGDWLVSVSYRVKQPSDSPEIKASWEAENVLWRDRLYNLNFEQ